jgi:hypothetical protein
MLKDLARVANRLDSLGLAKEADALDAIIRKLATEGDPEISEALKRESDLYFQSADPRWVDTSLPMDRLDNEFNRRFNPEKLNPPSSSSPAVSDPLQSTISYLDLESLEDPNDKQDFFFFLSSLIDRAENLAKPFEDISFIGPAKIITRDHKSDNFKIHPDFKKLYDKYGQPILDALWKYIDEAAEILSDRKDPDSNKRWMADEDFRNLKSKITRLKS